MQAPQPPSHKMDEMVCTYGVSLWLSCKPIVLLELCHPNLLGLCNRILLTLSPESC
jgi:hypothetical protein